ncbi:MAG: hypothetical protein LBS57_06665, partial [Treponema sp.]|nr:hypothetical protein [Treponema sp.]
MILKENTSCPFFAVACSLFTLLALLGGCDLFNDPEGNLARKIDQSVHDARAPFINVQVDSRGNGVSVPGGSLSNVKLEVPFTVKFEPFSDFGFLEWRAYLDGLKLDSPDVVFSAPNSPETSVTVNKDPGGGVIILIPEGEETAFVIDSGYYEPVLSNQCIQVHFS